MPESLTVDSRSSTPRRTQQQYPAGTALRVTVRGMYWMRQADDWIVADAECTISDRSRYWAAMRYDGIFNGRTSPLGDLAVNGDLVRWRPASGGGDCDTSDAHQYSYDLTTTKEGSLSFVVADDSYWNNSGKLEVEVTPR